MALRLYLNQEASERVLLQLVGNSRFLSDHDGVDCNGIVVKVDPDGRPYYEVRNDRLPLALLVPLRLQGKVDYYNWLVQLWPNCPTHQTGIYTHESAEATVEPSQNDRRRLMAHIYGPELEHVHELLRAIRAGRATLTESWSWEAEPEATSDTTNAADDGAEVESPALAVVTVEDTGRTHLGRSGVKLACPSCHAKYTIASEKVLGRTVKIRCKKCSHPIELTDGKVTNATPDDPANNGPMN